MAKITMNAYEDLMRRAADKLAELYDENKVLRDALLECMKDTFTAADGMSESGKLSFAGARYRQAVKAFSKEVEHTGETIDELEVLVRKAEGKRP